MKMELTQKDKKLLIFLAVFVIVVGLGYWGVRPLVQSIIKTEDAMADALEIKELNDSKADGLSEIQMENERLENELVSKRSEFYPIMTADEIDKAFTNKVLNYNLYAYKLDIQMPEGETSLDKYQYAAVTDETYEEEEDDFTYVEGAVTYEEEEEELATGIYMAEITMRLGGDESNLQRLIDDLSSAKEMHQVVSYRWDTSNNIDFNEDGTYELVMDKYLEIVIDIYMCAE